MAISDYSEPVAQLLTQGECSSHSNQSWLDYPSLGLSETDIPSLIRMATDDDLYELDAEVTAGWAPVHAWRALGQLRATAAIDPLLQHANEYVDEEGWWDWMAMELPKVFAMVGESIIPNLAKVVHDRTRASWARVIALDGLEAIAKQSQANDPEQIAVQQCCAIFLEELSQFEANERDFNAFVIGALAELQVMEAVPLIEQAFAAGKVDEMMHGDWNEIQVQLGLKSREEVPKRTIDPQLLQYLESLDRATSPSGFGRPTEQPSQSNRKAKQKQQTESRRKNRKKK